MTLYASDRLATLDLIRGVAVLGILAINIAGFAGPPAAVYTPFALGPASRLDAAVFGLSLVLFEGKMRALFAILFGASMELFVTRAEARGKPGETLQLRRLLWLALFGYLHFLLLWWGDILFSYAVAGTAALALRRLPGRLLLAGALLTFGLWQLQGAATELPAAVHEARVAAGSASASDARADTLRRAAIGNGARAELARVREGYAAQVAGKLADRPFAPMNAARFEFGEALPYMLIGMVLLRAGFFAGCWPAARLRWIAIAGIGVGGAATIAFALWARSREYPPAVMRLAVDYALSVPHLIMALGYAALLAMASRALLWTALGRAFARAGQMALSNYIGTSIVMTALFYGWGMGLVGHVGSAAQAVIVLLGWALMLAGSALWLARFRQGPLEWLWRSLIECRRLPLLR